MFPSLSTATPVRRAKVAGGGEIVVFAAGTDAAQELVGVGVVDDDLVLLGIDDIEEAVVGIDGDTDGVDQSLGDLVSRPGDWY